MFTIKFIDREGVENITEAKYVVADRTESGAPRVLVFDDLPSMAHDNSAGIYVGSPVQTAVPSMFGNGIVYVMNRNGATVAVYRL